MWKNDLPCLLEPNVFRRYIGLSHKPQALISSSFVRFISDLFIFSSLGFNFAILLVMFNFEFIKIYLILNDYFYVLLINISK